MNEINVEESIAEMQKSIAELQDNTNDTVKVLVLTVAAVASAWYIAGKVIDRKVARKVKAQKKEKS